MNHGSTLMAAAGSLLVSGAATAGAFQSLTMTAYTEVRAGAPSNSMTYRLFANLEAGARIDAVYGNAQGDLSINTTNGGTFYQNGNGGPTSKAINSAFFPFVPSMEWDSYVSIGAIDSNTNNLFDIAIDWSTFEAGGEISSDTGSWFTTPSDAQGGEVNGQVFLGQFTVLGGLGDASDLIGQLNLQGTDAGGNSWNEIGATWMESTDPSGPVVPGIGAFAPLACIGLVRRRRRG